MNNGQCETASHTLLDETFEILTKGEKKIKFKEDKKIILVLGNVRSGKTAFIQWIAEDNNNLVSKEVHEGSGEFVIVYDGDRIGNSTMIPKTIFPELIEDENSVYYDCPGFEDTTYVSNDIAKSHFIKKMADYAETLKIVFVIEYSSVRKGNKHEDFMKLIKHATTFIKDVEKFKDSISIVISKVDNQYIKIRNQFQLVSNEKIIESIADFLKDMKQTLEDKIDEKFYENATTFIDALLIKNENTFAKIGIFRRPDSAGFLNDIDLLKNGKKEVQKMILEHLKFTKTDLNDFDYTFSEKSQIAIYNLVDEIKKKITCYSKEISNEMLWQYQVLINKIKEKIQLFHSQKIVNIRVEQSEAQDFSMKINEDYLTLLNLTKEIAYSNSADDFLNKIQINFKKLGLNVSNKVLLNIKQQDKYLSFLQNISKIKFEIFSSDFIIELESLVSYLLKSKNEVKLDAKNLVKKVKSEIEHEVQNLNDNLKLSYKGKLKTTEIEQLLKDSNDLYNFTQSVLLANPGMNSPYAFVEEIKAGFGWLGTSAVDISFNIFHLTVNWQYLLVLKDEESVVNDSFFSQLGITFFETTKHYNQWIIFVNAVYKRLSEFDIQKDKSKAIEGLGLKEGVKASNFDQFLLKIRLLNLKDEFEEGFEPDEPELKLLNDALDAVLKGKIEFICEPDRFVLRGDFVKFTDLKDGFECERDLWQIFALNKLFIDDNLNKTGSKLKLAIISPILEIIGERTINLDGQKGSDHHFAIMNDHDGKPGLPGHSAGSFLAINKKIIDGCLLEIHANGGKGGKGQNGLEGVKGQSPNVGHIKKNFKKCEEICPKDQINDGKATFICHRSSACTGDYYCINIFPMSGSPGWNGGKGGFGGKKGNIEIFSKNDVSIRTVNNDGKSGIDGSGGIGGLDGDNGSIFCKGDVRFSQATLNKYFRSANGKDGGNKDDIQSPDAAVVIDDETKRSIIRQYKRFAKKNLNNRFKKDKLIKFYRFLKGDKFKSNCSILNCVNGFDALDNLDAEFHSLRQENETGLVELNLNSVDLFGNLVLGQLIAGKVCGSNKHLNANSYISPDLKRRIKINELSNRILPVLERFDNDEGKKYFSKLVG